MGGGENRECAMKPLGTLWEYRVVGPCLPILKCHSPPSITCKSLHLIMLLPSPTAGTLCLSWISWRSLKGKLSTVDRCSRNPPCGWITLALDCAMTPPPPAAPTALTRSTGTWQLQALSRSVAKTWAPGTVPRPTWSRSWRWRRFQPASAADWLAVEQFDDSKIKFPLPHQVLYHQHKPRFTTRRPSTFF